MEMAFFLPSLFTCLVIVLISLELCSILGPYKVLFIMYGGYWLGSYALAKPKPKLGLVPTFLSYEATQSALIYYYYDLINARIAQ